MSTGPTTKCMNCGKALSLTDPRNLGFCAGAICKLDAEYPRLMKLVRDSDNWKGVGRSLVRRTSGNRRQRRAVEAKARKAERATR